MALPAVGCRAGTLQKSLLLEAREDPAQVAAVESEVAAELDRRRAVTVRELVENTRLRQRERPAERRIVENADPLRIEAVESPDLGDITGNFAVRPHASQHRQIR